jgi:hypothetical protein
MIKRISYISEEAKFWFVASFFSLTVFAFVITTPGDRNIANSPSGFTQEFNKDQSAPDFAEIPIHPHQRFKYDHAEEVTFKTEIEDKNKEY